MSSSLTTTTTTTTNHFSNQNHQSAARRIMANSESSTPGTGHRDQPRSSVNHATQIISITGRCGPSLVTYKNLRFLITDKPTDPTLLQYIEELQRQRVTDVVRVCESTYSPKRLEAAGIKCHDWAFDDGTPPPPHIITDWLNLILERFRPSVGGSTSATSSHNGGDSPQQQQSGPCIAVHCVAGLGRAPVLVAIALIEAGMKYEDAVEMIRDVRRGAINAKQLTYLSEYRSKKLLLQVIKGDGGKRKFCCII